MAGWPRGSRAIIMSVGTATGIRTESRAPLFRLRLASLPFATFYDALTHDKAYRGAFSSDQAVAEIVRGRGMQFDPQLVDLFVPLLARLRGEHPDLDAFLAEAARRSQLTLARQRIAESLVKPIDEVHSERRSAPASVRRLIP